MTALNAEILINSYSVISPRGLHQYLFVLTLPVAVLCAWLAIFSVLNWPGIRKPLMALLLTASAVDALSSHSFSRTIEAMLAANLGELHLGQALSLITPRFIMTVMLPGLIPAAIVACLYIQRPGCWWQALLLRAVICLASLMIIMLVTALFYRDYASLLHHRQTLIKTALWRDDTGAVINSPRRPRFNGSAPPSSASSRR